MRPTVALLAMIALTVVGASNVVAIKAGTNHWPPLLLGALRMGLVALGLLAWILVTRQGVLPPKGLARSESVRAALAKAIGLVGFYIGISETQVVEATVVSSLSPLITAVFAHWLVPNDRLNAGKAIGFVFGAVGVFMLLGGNPGTLNGNLLILWGVVWTGLMIVYEKRALTAGSKPAQLALITTFGSLVVLAPASVLRGEPLRGPTGPEGWWILLYLVTVVGVALFLVRRWLLLRLPVTYMAFFSYPRKAVALFYGAVFLGEAVTAVIVVPLLLVLAGVSISQRYLPSRPTKADSEPSALPGGAPPTPP